MKKILALLMVLLLGISLCACGSANSGNVEAQLKGKWQMDAGEAVTAIYSFSNGSVSCQTTAMGITLDPNEGTYDITNSQIVITWTNNGKSVEFDYTLNDDGLTLKSEDGTSLYKIN